MSTVRTAVIPVAGLGTRLLPASKAIPKEMLTVVDRPVIQHVVEEAVSAGIRKIVLVTRSGKESIENHFDSNFELERQLESKGRQDLLESVRNTLPRGTEVLSIRQPVAAGLGDAIRCAAPAVGNEPFAVMLPDVLFSSLEDARENMTSLARAFTRTGAAQILVESVPDSVVDQYGIVDCGVRTLPAGESARIHGLVEKPAVGEAPSNFSIVGRYILPPAVMKILETTTRGVGGEIQLTDALLTLLRHEPTHAVMMHGYSFDCGNNLGLLKANIALGLQDAAMEPALVNFLGGLLDDYRSKQAQTAYLGAA